MSETVIDINNRLRANKPQERKIKVSPETRALIERIERLNKRKKWIDDRLDGKTGAKTLLKAAADCPALKDSKVVFEDRDKILASVACQNSPISFDLKGYLEKHPERNGDVEAFTKRGVCLVVRTH